MSRLLRGRRLPASPRIPSCSSSAAFTTSPPDRIPSSRQRSYHRFRRRPLRRGRVAIANSIHPSSAPEQRGSRQSRGKSEGNSSPSWAPIPAPTSSASLSCAPKHMVEIFRKPRAGTENHILSLWSQSTNHLPSRPTSANPDSGLLPDIATESAAMTDFKRAMPPKAPGTPRTSSPGPLHSDYLRQQVSKQQKNNYHSSSLRNMNVNKTNLHPSGVTCVPRCRSPVRCRRADVVARQAIGAPHRTRGAAARGCPHRL